MISNRTAAASTRKNEKRLLCIKKIVKSRKDLSPEFKFAFGIYVNQTIENIRERNITTYHDLIDYFRDRVEWAIENNELLTPEEKQEKIFLVHLLAELAKLRRCSRKPFYPVVMRGRLVKR